MFSGQPHTLFIPETAKHIKRQKYSAPLLSDTFTNYAQCNRCILSFCTKNKNVMQKRVHLMSTKL